MDVFLGILSSRPLETSRNFFDSAEAPEALFILKALRLSVVYKSINVHLGQGQDLIMSIQVYENVGFCILCIADFKILEIFQNCRNVSRFFTEKRHRRQYPPPSNVHMTFLADNIMDKICGNRCHSIPPPPPPPPPPPQYQCCWRQNSFFTQGFYQK